ncbi:MAG: hypothetical protein GX154_08505 [Clostridiales bacterium]|nr:hypothetical protein [Clostridiales bacterium]
MPRHYFAIAKLNIMEYTEAASLFQSKRKTKHKPLYDMWLKSAVRYSQIIVDWYLSGHESRQDMDTLRSRAHDAFISNCNALSRNMNEAGIYSSWRAKLIDDRRIIGNFACYVHTTLGIAAR